MKFDETFLGAVEFGNVFAFDNGGGLPSVGEILVHAAILRAECERVVNENVVLHGISMVFSAGRQGRSLAGFQFIKRRYEREI